MCDTLAIRREGAVWFAKNSDREPDEVQRVEIYPPSRGNASAKLRCTHIEIEQIDERRGVVLSRPGWMWGAEMGVNDAGVAIGNEAVFSRSVLKRGEALLGMDLVRLGLERASGAAEAVDIMTGLLERYGQGGGAGFRDRNFRYDNSFLIADAHTIFVLETAGREWAVKDARDGWSLSNAYTLGADYDRSSLTGEIDFRSAHEAFAMPKLARAALRRAATMKFVQCAPQDMSLADLAGALRSHAGGDGFARGSNRDVCMHADGMLRPHASTASMIVRLSDGGPRIAFTGTIHPCISLFKPVSFDAGNWTVCDETLFAKGVAASLRARKDKAWRDAVRSAIALEEPALLSALEAGDLAAAELRAAAWTAKWISGPRPA